MTSTPLDDTRVPARFKLAALWTSVMFCYVYGDYFGLYQPGKLQHMLDGQMEPLGPTTQGVLLGTSLMMALPALMVFFSLALPPVPCRWANIIMGSAYTLIMLATMPGAWLFYLFLGAIEVALTLSVVWHAWLWPRQASRPAMPSAS